MRRVVIFSALVMGCAAPLGEEPEPEPVVEDRPIDRLNLPSFQHPMWGKRRRP